MSYMKLNQIIAAGLLLTMGTILTHGKSASSLGGSELASAKMNRGSVSKAPTKLTRMNKRVLNFRLGEKKGELGFLSSWLPDQSGNPTEIFEGPSALAVNSSGHLFFLDAIREEVQEFDRQGKFLRSIALPQAREDLEHVYSDIVIQGKNILVLDTQNYLVARIAPESPGVHSFTQIPEEAGESLPLIIDGFGTDSRGNLLVQNRYDGAVFQLQLPKDNSNPYLLKEVVGAPPFRASLNLDSQNRVLGQEFHEEDPTIVEFFRWKAGDKDSEKLFALPSIPNLFFVEIVGVIDQDPVLAVFTGGEERSRLSQLLRYKLDGTLVSSIKLNVQEIPWTMNHRYQILDNHVYLSEFRTFGKRLRVMRFTL